MRAPPVRSGWSRSSSPPRRFDRPAAAWPPSAAELDVGGRPLVLALGRLHHQKRFDVLVAAAARWADDTDCRSS